MHATDAIDVDAVVLVEKVEHVLVAAQTSERVRGVSSPVAQIEIGAKVDQMSHARKRSKPRRNVNGRRSTAVDLVHVLTRFEQREEGCGVAFHGRRVERTEDGCCGVSFAFFNLLLVFFVGIVIGLVFHLLGLFGRHPASRACQDRQRLF